MLLADASATAGGIGFLVVAALIVAGVFLFRSLNRHVKTVRNADWVREQRAEEAAAAEAVPAAPQQQPPQP